ncbi:Selenocysteine synthase [seryl-tRNASer selenium transferase] [Citrobacter freundii]|nr:Selenocysteine synthase [seryl-tRNASer selenium transferase] [Citrobacter freundii]
MKVGKEGILGLTCAIELYLNAQKESGAEMVEKMTPFINALNQLHGVSARVVWDSAGRDIARAEIKFDEALTGIATGELVDALKQGSTRFTSAVTKPTKALSKPMCAAWIARNWRLWPVEWVK